MCEQKSLWHELGARKTAQPPCAALVRHPVARVCAGYAALRREGALQAYADINEFCANLWQHLAHPFFAPQHRFVLDADQMPLCPWVRQEDRAGAARLTRKGYAPFPLSATPIAEPEERQLSAASREQIGALYHRDFRLFGYAPPSPTPLIRILDAAAEAGCAPALVFWSKKFAEIYRLWRLRHDAFSARPVVAIYLQAAGESARKPRPRFVLRFGTEGAVSAQSEEQFHRSGGLWRLRMEVFFLLMVNAYDFVHFDADAFVLKPYDWLLARQRAPFLFSRGRIPHHVLAKIGFTGCCGFFAARSARIALRDAIQIQTLCRKQPDPDDQVAFNTFFLQKSAYALLPPEHCSLARAARLRPDNVAPDETDQRERFWADWGADWHDRSHQVMVQVLPLSLVSRFHWGRGLAGASIWHIKRYRYRPANARKYAGQGDAQFQRVRALTPRWQLRLRALLLRLRFRFGKRPQWRAGSRS